MKKLILISLLFTGCVNTDSVKEAETLKDTIIEVETDTVAKCVVLPTVAK